MVFEFELDLMRRLSVDLEGGGLRRLQRAKAGGCQIAGDTEDARAVRTVRRQVDLDDRIIEAA